MIYIHYSPVYQKISGEAVRRWKFRRQTFQSSCVINNDGIMGIENHNEMNSFGAIEC